MLAPNTDNLKKNNPRRFSIDDRVALDSGEDMVSFQTQSKEKSTSFREKSNSFRNKFIEDLKLQPLASKSKNGKQFRISFVD